MPAGPLATMQDVGASPDPFAMIVALAASAAFMTAVSSPVKPLVAGPGNRSLADFIKAGVRFTTIVVIVCVLLVPIVLPLQGDRGRVPAPHRTMAVFPGGLPAGAPRR